MDQIIGDRSSEAEARIEPVAPPTAEERAWAEIGGAHSAIVAASRLDVAIQLEAGRSVPVAFSDYAALERWARAFTSDSPYRIGEISTNDALLVSSIRRHDRPNSEPYDQVWVRAGYDGYRNALVQHAIDSYSMTREDLEGLDSRPTAWLHPLSLHASVRAAKRSVGRPFASLSPGAR